MNNQLLSFLGICRRAGKMTLGYDSVVSSVTNGESCLVIMADDISPRTEKHLTEALTGTPVSIMKVPYDRNTLGKSLGKFTAIISVNDRGFAVKITELIENSQ